MEQLKKHVKQNMVHIEELMMFDDETIKEFFAIDDVYYTLDTESCDNDVTAWVYAWSIGNTKNDMQIYGENINDVYSAFDRIARAHNTKYNAKKGSVEKFNVFVHNLKWDFEFFKYSLHEMGFEMYFGTVKYNKKMGVLQPGTFSMVENNGEVYSANIKLHDTMQFVSTRKNRNGEYKKQEIAIEIELIDSMKIMNKKLSEIAIDVLEIDEMFLKIDNYDYNTIREKGHVLTLDEKCYLYNDVYILKEFIKQFYIPLGTTKATASSIAFEKFLHHTFKQKSFSDDYKIFCSLYPDLTGYRRAYDMINKSYRGGWTQGNRKYIGDVLQLNNAVSIDINSSYPSVVKYKMLPYGEPVYFEGYPNIDEVRMMGYDMELVTIAFDGFANNDEDNLIGEIQARRNAEAFGMKGTEYAHTNIIGGVRKGDTITDYEIVGEENATEKRRFTKTIWMFELENMLENMSFYLEDKRYDKTLGMWLSKGKLKKGFEIIRTLSFKGSVGMFADAVDYYNAQKIEGKKTNNKCLTESAKMMMNSFYGKMGSADVRMDRCLEINDNGQIVFGNAVHSYKSNKKYYKAFASAVTAWGRVNLRTTLYKIGYNNILYFDTDSLYTTITLDEVKDRCGEIIHKTDLGKWDHEKTYNKFKCIGAKKYMVETVEGETICKCAGLPADVKENITFEEFEMGATFEGKKNMKTIKGGYKMTTGTYKIRETLY